MRLCPAADGRETFLLYRSAERVEKERAMHDRFENQLEEGLGQIAAMANQCGRGLGNGAPGQATAGTEHADGWIV